MRAQTNSYAVTRITLGLTTFLSFEDNFAESDSPLFRQFAQPPGQICFRPVAHDFLSVAPSGSLFLR